MRSIAALALLSTLLSAVPASAANEPPISLPKLSSWQMNYGDDTCQLAARFGSAKNSVILELRREQPGDAIDLQLFGQRLQFKGLNVPVELTFGSNGVPHVRDGTSMIVDGPNKLPLVRLTGLLIDGSFDQKHPDMILPAISPAREAKVTSITFKLPSAKRYRLETGSMGIPLAAMRVCTDDLIKGWGYDPTVQSALVRLVTPANNPAKWVSTSDIPSKITVMHYGLIRFRLDIDPAGNPVGCKVLYRTNPDEFSDLSCKLLLKRARFKPALDAQGKPVKSFYINSIQWTAPHG